MITSAKKLILSFDLIIQIVIVFFLLYSYLVTHQEEALFINTMILLLAAIFNPIGALLNVLVKNPSKTFHRLRLIYLIAIPIYFIFLKTLMLLTDSASSIFSMDLFTNRINIFIINIYALVYAGITFFEFASLFKEPKNKSI